MSSFICADCLIEFEPIDLKELEWRKGRCSCCEFITDVAELD